MDHPEHELRYIAEKLRALERSYQLERQRFRDVARIFGACDQCWGYEPQCPECQGRGIPGFHLPQDEEKLSRWVRPLVNRLQARARRPTAERDSGSRRR